MHGKHFDELMSTLTLGTLMSIDAGGLGPKLDALTDLVKANHASEMAAMRKSHSSEMAQVNTATSEIGRQLADIAYGIKDEAQHETATALLRAARALDAIGKTQPIATEKTHVQER